MTRKQPVAVIAATQSLTKLGMDHGIEAVHTAYAEAIAELMACREREAWRVKVADGQREIFALIGHGY